MLTAAAGYVDAVSYLALGRVFTANMTGNTVLLGLSLVQAHPKSHGLGDRRHSIGTVRLASWRGSPHGSRSIVR